jgi:hypothetical protein
MSDAAILVGWDRPLPGRESDALALLDRLYRYLEQIKTSGQIGSYTRVWLEPHGGSLNGFVLIEGGGAELQALKQTEAWNDGVSRLTLALDGVTVNHARVGAGADREDARMTRLLKH